MMNGYFVSLVSWFLVLGAKHKKLFESVTKNTINKHKSLVIVIFGHAFP